MATDMNETQVRTLEQVRQVLEGTQALLLNARQPEERYAWIAQVLQRLAYRRLGATTEVQCWRMCSASAATAAPKSPD